MSSYWVLLCIVLLLLLTEDGVISIFPFPSSDLEALQSIFNETNGNNWYWSPSGGNSWNFGAINDTYNPCSANWQYLICSSDCTLAPCSISYLVFVENMMIGQLPDIFDQFSNLISIQIEFQNFLTGTCYTTPSEINFFFFFFSYKIYICFKVLFHKAFVLCRTCCQYCLLLLAFQGKFPPVLETCRVYNYFTFRMFHSTEVYPLK